MRGSGWRARAPRRGYASRNAGGCLLACLGLFAQELPAYTVLGKLGTAGHCLSTPAVDGMDYWCCHTAHALVVMQGMFYTIQA